MRAHLLVLLSRDPVGEQPCGGRRVRGSLTIILWRRGISSAPGEFLLLLLLALFVWGSTDRPKSCRAYPVNPRLHSGEQPSIGYTCCASHTPADSSNLRQSEATPRLPRRRLKDRPVRSESPAAEGLCTTVGPRPMEVTIACCDGELVPEGGLPRRPTGTPRHGPRVETAPATGCGAEVGGAWTRGGRLAAPLLSITPSDASGRGGPPLRASALREW